MQISVHMTCMSVQMINKEIEMKNFSFATQISSSAGEFHVDEINIKWRNNSILFFTRKAPGDNLFGYVEIVEYQAMYRVR
jgi:hypothetical protein